MKIALTGVTGKLRGKAADILKGFLGKHLYRHCQGRTGWCIWGFGKGAGEKGGLFGGISGAARGRSLRAGWRPEDCIKP